MHTPEPNPATPTAPEPAPSPTGSGQSAQTCGKCGEPLGTDRGLRHFGFYTAHQEDTCIRLLQARADAAEAKLAEAQEATQRMKRKRMLVADQCDTALVESAEMRKQRDILGKQVIILTAEINRLRKGINEIKAGTRIGWLMTDLGAKCSTLLNE